MAEKRPRRPRPPLDAERLNELMLAYVARFATSRSKLKAYLTRKVRERGWAGLGEPPTDDLVAKAARVGFVDDAAYALGKARSLTQRGYGSRRVRQALLAAGIGEEDSASAHDHAEESAVQAALRFARRRRLGPYAAHLADPHLREKQLAAMLRAGHGLRLSKAILKLGPGAEIDMQTLEEQV